MPRKRDGRCTDIDAFSAKLAQAAELKGVSVETLCQYLFKDSRLPGRVRRQRETLTRRRAKLDGFIASFSKRGAADPVEGGGDA